MCFGNILKIRLIKVLYFTFSFVILLKRGILTKGREEREVGEAACVAARTTYATNVRSSNCSQR